MRWRPTSHRKVLCVFRAAFAKIKRNILREALYTPIFMKKGFMNNYTLWTKHGEPRVVMQDSEGDDDDNIANWAHLYEDD